MKAKKIIVFFLSILLLCSIVGCDFFADIVTPKTQNGNSSKQAPSFSLKLLDGTEFNLENYKGKPVMINFWATWCPPCRQEIPALNASYKKYKNDVQFIGIAMSSDKESDVRAFVRDNSILYPVGIDTTSEISNDYRVQAIPATFFITKNGEILDSHVGAMNEDQFSEKIKELLK